MRPFARKAIRVERDVPRRQHLLLVAEDAGGKQVQEAMLAAGRQRVMQTRRRLEPQPLVAAAADELRDLLDGGNARAAAAQLRLALAEDDVALPLLGPVDDSEWLGVHKLRHVPARTTKRFTSHASSEARMRRHSASASSSGSSAGGKTPA